jgi:large subunit ribosomal protein L3
MSTAMDEGGFAVPVTLLQPYTVTVTEIRRPERNGYSAVQLAFGETRAKLVNKPNAGVLKKAGCTASLRKFYESRQAELEGLELGQQINPAEESESWKSFKVTGTSKGKGFAGAVKRWGFAGQQRTHGDPDNRRSMSNGATDAARVFRGSRRAGHLGAAQISVHDVKLQAYNADLNLIAVKGSVPGPNGAVVFLTVQGKKG